MIHRTLLRSMSRDHYSMLIGKFKNVYEIDVVNIKGEWEKMQVHEDTMRGFQLSAKCVLVCTKNMNPPGSRGHTATIYVDTFEKLRHIHCAGNTYHLVPMQAHSVSAFEAMVDIARSPGAPFTIHDRVDYTPYRCQMTCRSPVRKACEMFFGVKPDDARTPVDYIHFDAAFVSRVGAGQRTASRNNVASAGLIYVKGAVTAASIEFCANQWEFCRSDAFLDGTGINPVGIWDVMKEADAENKFHLFHVSDAPLDNTRSTQRLAALAGERGVHLYHRSHAPHGPFVYLPPPQGVSKKVFDPKAWMAAKFPGSVLPTTATSASAAS